MRRDGGAPRARDDEEETAERRRRERFFGFRFALGRKTGDACIVPSRTSLHACQTSHPPPTSQTPATRKSVTEAATALAVHPPMRPARVADAAHQWRRAPKGKPKKKSACRFFASERKSCASRKRPRACAQTQAGLGREAFYPLPSGSRITNRRRVRVSRRRFVSTPARFSRLISHTFGTRESRHPRRSPCRSPRKGIVRARVRFLTRR